jgi:hypothetical protein
VQVVQVGRKGGSGAGYVWRVSTGRLRRVHDAACHPLVCWQEHIMSLSRGETVMTPVYNMKTGFRDPPVWGG